MATTGGPNLIAIVAAIIGIGVVAQVLSDRFQVPSVVFLILAGVLFGPEVLGVVGPDSFGNALGAVAWYVDDILATIVAGMAVLWLLRFGL